MANTGVDMAIAALTAWLEGVDRSDPEAVEVAVDTGFVVEVVSGYMEDTTETRSEFLGGLVNLSGILLLALERETGVPARTILQNEARRHAEGEAGPPGE